jgi:hypothetical protein
LCGKTSKAKKGKRECVKVVEFKCCNPSLGFTTKAKELARLLAKRKLGSHTACSRECRKVNSLFGKWTLGGFSNLQNAIAGVKT